MPSAKVGSPICWWQREPRALEVVRGIDVLTAQEDQSSELEDGPLLTRATELGRILVSQDADLLREGARLIDEGIEFSGTVCAHQRR